jgi:hypothetical protein
MLLVDASTCTVCSMHHLCWATLCRVYPIQLHFIWYTLFQKPIKIYTFLHRIATTKFVSSGNKSGLNSLGTRYASLLSYNTSSGFLQPCRQIQGFWLELARDRFVHILSYSFSIIVSLDSTEVQSELLTASLNRQTLQIGLFSVYCWFSSLRLIEMRKS